MASDELRLSNNDYYPVTSSSLRQSFPTNNGS